MSNETIQPDHPSTEELTKLDQEIKEMMSALNSRLAELQGVQKPGSSSSKSEDADESGIRIITIAGTNTGATMHGELGDRDDASDNEGSGTYVNSNFQAVNNSIMLGASYTGKDPGVRVDISDVSQHLQDKAAGGGKGGE
ncbi:hypothetical protein Nepgr_015720 [Nepenthes gracilis]|uniref:Uncharacterized protein n=1 Tax=Nepenthes gracilis TaxID=150966 RepID=A0AAD3SNA0_NEPGR|nr:hypothetical protein Nepgr_015720 [Nepenthes gracilis]